ncbi:hypothetical protein [uncultured Gammaproteobacteria bacterium]|nr:hypothetical protein [uncultured Gammaproteobacteria bacterium]
MARKLTKRALKDRVLLVSEGKKTEQYYFKGLCQHLRISIEIKDINKTSLGSLLEKVIRIVNQAKYEKNLFTQVLFIGDKDNFKHYKQDKQKIQSLNNFHVFFSEPCFEYWLLLHFQPISKPFNSCSELQKSKAFKKYFPDYSKVNADIYVELRDKIVDACNNAENNQNININELVRYLQNIKNQ